MCGDEQIIGADGRALTRQVVPDVCVVSVGGRLERQDLQSRKDQAEAVANLSGSRFLGAVAKRRGNDDPGADRVLAGRGNTAATVPRGCRIRSDRAFVSSR